ncbi:MULTISPECIES: hypothetical protein [unclassified Ornithinimicrobium]|uniref:hypothetical protein n=1 Tax=unclassified Ornithinimicrobium TaxID=2615080 RepID=UPI0038527EC9
MNDTSTLTLTFADGEGVADLATYVARSRTLDADGAIRLQAVGPVLAGWVCVVPGQGLMRSGLVLGLRTMALADDHRLDVTVPLTALADRFARRGATGDAGATLSVPPTQVVPQWASVSPPRGSWEPEGEVSTEALLAAAEEGIAEVAQGAPTGSGAAAVAMLRARVWAREVQGGATAGAGLAARVLGFARPGDGRVATVHRSGVWTRVTFPTGHVLSR